MSCHVHATEDHLCGRETDAGFVQKLYQRFVGLDGRMEQFEGGALGGGSSVSFHSGHELNSTSCRCEVGDDEYSNKVENSDKEWSGSWGGRSCFFFLSFFVLCRTTRVRNAFDDGRTWKDEKSIL